MKGAHRKSQQKNPEDIKDQMKIIELKDNWNKKLCGWTQQQKGKEGGKNQWTKKMEQ